MRAGRTSVRVPSGEARGVAGNYSATFKMFSATWDHLHCRLEPPPFRLLRRVPLGSSGKTLLFVVCDEADAVDASQFLDLVLDDDDGD